jgi:hypothetical protein
MLAIDIGGTKLASTNRRDDVAGRAAQKRSNVRSSSGVLISYG